MQQRRTVDAHRLIAAAVFLFVSGCRTTQTTPDESSAIFSNRYGRAPRNLTLRTGMPLEEACALLLHRDYSLNPVVGLSMRAMDGQLRPPSFYTPLCGDRALIVFSSSTRRGTGAVVSVMEVMTGHGHPKSERMWTATAEFDLAPHRYGCAPAGSEECKAE